MIGLDYKGANTMIMRGSKGGFTLIELLITMLVSSVVMAAIYSVYQSQTKSHRTQQFVVEMQQNMRAAMFLLEREIRMAGYSAADPASNGGFVLNFNSFGPPHSGSGAVNDANNIAFTVDNDDSGAIETATTFELIAYRRDAGNNTLERWDAVSGQWQVAAEKITNLTFSYHGADGSQMAFPLTAGDLPNIRSVELAIAATSGDRTMNLTNKIKCRNMGF